MDFSKASLADMKAFAKDNGIKGCSAMKKAELSQFLADYVEKQDAVSFTSPISFLPALSTDTAVTCFST